MKYPQIFLFSNLLLLAGIVQAQSTKHSGCVKPLEWNPQVLLLTEGASCYELTGKAVSNRLDGHVIQMSGLAKEATDTTRATLAVDHVEKIGDACTQTCTPQPPDDHGRGVSKIEKKGSKGGTAGRQSETTPP